MENVNDSKLRIIKRYKNRKLYDTEGACYITLDRLLEIASVEPSVVVFDNVTQDDITNAVLATALAGSPLFASRIAQAYLKGALA